MDQQAYERRFRRAGLPLFIEGYTARTDVFTRAAPLLTLVFLGEMLGAIDLDWGFLANVGAVLGGLAILVGAFGLVNRLRGRAFWCLPDDVGAPELSAFVLLPAALPLIFGGQATSALVTALVNLALVLLILAVGYGLPWILRWVGARLFAQLAASLGMLARAVPLLMIFSLVLFLTVEMWEIFAREPRPLLLLTGALFALLTCSFLLVRLPREVRSLEREAGGSGPALDPRQLVNVGFVLFVSQGLQVLVVSLAVGLFFVVFGALAIPPDVRDGWIGDPAEVLFTLTLFDEPVEVSRELLRVAGGIAAFSGLYYAIAVLTDSSYREEFLTEVTGEMRESFRLRAEYLGRRAA